MASKPLSSKKPVALAPRTAVAPGGLTAPQKPAAKRQRVVHGVRTCDHGRATAGAGTGPVEPGIYLPLASDSRTARSHRVLAPTLKPTRVSEEEIAEAVRNFRRN